ncbi:phage portal protein [Catenovulum sediminis]|uniref:phage portal protein n=1 Tax=Catenovulum sediminis TaxID=1740262 RepID=UPI00117F5B6E|nr:phage portal protein [Catenovulum sediminis]
MGFFNKIFGSNNTKSEPINTSAELLAQINSVLSDAGISVTPENVKRIATVFSCVRVLSESIGMLPLNLKEQKGRVKETLTGHKLHKLVHSKPNGFMTPIEWKELVVTHLCFRGNHYSYINKINGVARELLPLNPDNVEPKMDENWEVEYKVTFPNGHVEMLSKDEILHIKIFSEDGLTGMSPVRYCANTFGLAKATERHGNLLFKNAAMPSGGYSTEGKLTDEQFNRLKSQMDEFKGEGNHKNLILEGGLKWFTVTMTSEDAQFLETRAFQQAEICGIYRVPPHKIGILDKATFSNIEHQGLDFVTSSLMPYCIRIEERLNISLLNENEIGNKFFKFNERALLRGDMKARADFYTKMFNVGAYSSNDIRDFEDENPRDGGDVYLVPLNMTNKPGQQDDSKN